MEKCERRKVRWILAVSNGVNECVWPFLPVFLVLVCLFAITGAIGCLWGIQMQQARSDVAYIDHTQVSVQDVVQILIQDMAIQLASLESSGTMHARVLQERQAILNRLFFIAVFFEAYSPETAQQARDLILQYSEKL